MANLLSDLVKALADGGIEQVPDGWKTAQQIAHESGKSRPRTSEVLRAGMRAKLIQTQVFRVRRGDKVYPVPHYRKMPERSDT